MTQFPATTKPRKRWLLWIILGAVALLFVSCVAAVAGGDDEPDVVVTPPPPATAAPVAPAPAPTASAPADPAPAPPAAPAGPLTTFGNGEGYIVGTDIEPGNYRSPGPRTAQFGGALCYYDVKDGESFADQGVVPEGPARVTLEDGQTFTSSGCQDWVRSE